MRGGGGGSVLRGGVIIERESVMPVLRGCISIERVCQYEGCVLVLRGCVSACVWVPGLHQPQCSWFEQDGLTQRKWQQGSSSNGQGLVCGV